MPECRLTVFVGPTPNPTLDNQSSSHIIYRGPSFHLWTILAFLYQCLKLMCPSFGCRMHIFWYLCTLFQSIYIHFIALNTDKIRPVRDFESLCNWCVHKINAYFEQRYFRAAKFSRSLPLVVFSRGQIFAHLAINPISTTVINFFTHIVFSRIYCHAPNHTRKYVPRENIYVYSNNFKHCYTTICVLPAPSVVHVLIHFLSQLYVGVLLGRCHPVDHVLRHLIIWDLHVTYCNHGRRVVIVVTLHLLHTPDG